MKVVPETAPLPSDEEEGRYACTQARVTLVVASVVLAVGCTFAYLTAADQVLRQQQEAWDDSIACLSELFDVDISKHLDDLDTAGTLMASSAQPDWETFAAFANTTGSQLPGRGTMAWMPKVTASNLTAFEAEANKEYKQLFGTTFNVSTVINGTTLADARPDPDWRPVYYPLQYIYPFDVLQSYLILLDLFWFQPLGSLITETLESQTALLASPSVSITSAGDVTSSALIFAPAADLGVVVSTVVYEDLLREVAKSVEGPAILHLVDDTARRSLVAMTEEGDVLSQNDSYSAVKTRCHSRQFCTQSQISTGQRKLSVYAYTRTAVSVYTSRVPLVVLVSCSCLSIGLVIALYCYYRHQEQVQRLIAQEVALAHRQMLDYVCHELRNPLHAMTSTLGFAKSLLEHRPLASKDADALQQEIEHVEWSADILRVIVDDVLDTSRLSHASIELCKEAHDLRLLLQRLAIQFGRGAAVPILVDVSNEVPNALLFDRDRVRQVIVNGLSNAIRYTDEGNIIVRAYVEGDHLHVQIRDTGGGFRGVAPEMLFDRFVTGAAAGAGSRGASSGLGLHISREIVRAHSGGIELTEISHPGSPSTHQARRGACYHFWIPLLKADLPRIATPSPAESTPSSSQAVNFANVRVVAADDERMNRKVLAGMLAQTGIRTEHVQILADGTDFVEKMATYRISDRFTTVVFLDQIMRNMNGDEACQEWRKLRPDMKHVQAFATTGNASHEFHGSLLAAGFNGVITKPFDASDIESAIRRAIQQRQATSK